LAGVSADGKTSDYLGSIKEGILLARKHEDLWLWDVVNRIVEEATDDIQKFYRDDHLELWCPDDPDAPLGDTLQFSVCHDEDANCKTIKIADLVVPAIENKLVDHGVLRSVDGRLETEFGDAVTFRRALCRLLRMGVVGQVFTDILKFAKQVQENQGKNSTSSSKASRDGRA
jgi:hypothetical protein